MIKIAMPQKVIENHKKYYREKVLPDIQDELNKLNDSEGLNGIIAYKNFLSLCLDNWEKFAIGSVAELRVLDDQLCKQWDDLKNDKEKVSSIFLKAYDRFIYVPKKLIKQWENNVDPKDMEWCAYTYLKMLSNLQVCPYCNKNFIHPTLTEDGKVRGDLDHFFSKEKHPYLALSIYNLIPCCRYCNSSLKGKQEFNVENIISPYEVSYNDLFEFKGPDSPSEGIQIVNNDEDVLVDEYLEMFKIKERYQNNRDILEKFQQKNQEYGSAFIEQFNMNFGLGKLQISIREFWSDFYDYPLNKEDIDKNIMSKLKRDLAVDVLGHEWLKGDK
ncbi:MAG: hypothetical protein K6C05_02175 [Anaerovibrio sp.]|uniref:hypothetical protein n=1 Tax=Anaerovibrio sp. TaxID=1872532 RepID=UPI0025FCA3D0|nr:hypothetical protein [Anaerovibrio sp.]MCR5175638.1 hypothetical protein [Anaerovibrio sp.]